MEKLDIDANNFIKMEKKVLGYLRGKTAVKNISSAATDAYYNFDLKHGFNFSTTWKVAACKTGDLDLTVAGLVELDGKGHFTFVSYVFCISRDKCLLRKYHYDCECERGNSKPLYHLQFGGESLPEHEGYRGIDELNCWLSEPRLFYTPMSLALILEQAFLEFRDESTEKIRKDSYWKGLVTASQCEVLKPYFKRCYDKISNNERLYSECYI
nr:hypothetical protein [uncultured Desulfuromonas sp.]